MKLCSITHHLKKNSRGSMPQTPSKRLATPRVTSSFAACNSPSPPKVAPLANCTYSHGLLLRNLLKEIHSYNPQFTVCSTLMFMHYNFFRGQK